MKIIQAISSLGNGGAEKLVVELANEMSLEHQVKIISFRDVEEWMFPPKSLIEDVGLITFGKKGGFDYRLILKLFKQLKKEKPDIVHIHLNSTLTYFLPLIPLFSKVKFVFTIHNTFGPHKKSVSRLGKLYFYKRVENVCLSESIYEQFSRSFPKLKFACIENGVKNSDFSSDYDSVETEFKEIRKKYLRVLLFVGRLTYQKNIPLLLKVLDNEISQNIKLLIIGDGEEEFKNNIFQYQEKTAKRIEYLGSKQNVFDYMHFSDALILTSRYEGMPIVAIEALQTGTPVISTPVGGVPDMIEDGVNGFLSNNESEKDIITTLKKWIKLIPEERKQIKQNNIQKFNDQFSIEACAAKHLVLYHKLLDK